MDNQIVRVAIYLICFMASMYGLEAVNLEKIIKSGRVLQAQILFFLLAMALAYLVGSFLINLSLG